MRTRRGGIVTNVDGIVTNVDGIAQRPG